MTTQMNLLFPKPDQYLILDWSNFIYRAYYTVNSQKNRESLNNSMNGKNNVNSRRKVLELLAYMLAKQLKRNPHKTFVALEGNGKEHRQRILPEYKAQRSTDNEEEILELQAASLNMLLGTCCEVVRAPEGEADDAIAVIVKRLPRAAAAMIVSEDRDLWQLIRGDRIVVHTRRHGRVNESLCEKLSGVKPNRIGCLKAYMGDTSDNVPRAIPRMRTAHIQTLAELDELPGRAYKKAAEAKALSKKVLERIVKHKEDIKRNFEVVRLRDTLEIQSRSGERSLHEFVEEEQLNIDRDTIALLTGHQPHESKSEGN